MFRGFIIGKVADVGLVDGLIICSYRRLFVVPDGRIVYGRFSGAGECNDVISRVRGWVLNESNKVMN